VIDAERAGVINLLEPIVAGVIGYFIGERLGVLGYIGAAMILVGIVVVERGTHPTRSDPTVPNPLGDVTRVTVDR
jgi:drug/metabolite transporter (DMT)-like permease